jgi:hypothetical protein
MMNDECGMMNEEQLVLNSSFIIHHLLCAFCASEVNVLRFVVDSPPDLA